MMSESKHIIIWGAGGHARVITDIVKLQGIFEIVGYLDSFNLSRKEKEFLGKPILGGYDQLDCLIEQGLSQVIIGFGDCKARIKAAADAKKKGFKLITVIHPSAIVADDVIIGAGTVIAANAVINPATIIGDNVIINTSSSVDHECRIADGVHICPGVHLSGGVTVEKAAWVGIGASVVANMRIGAGSVVGAGAVVVRNIPSGVVAYGNPARVERVIEK